MKKFFGEFKTFITRGNVLDMSVGIIVGSAFTAIVNSMGNNILKPVINWILTSIFGKDSLSELYTYLTPPVYAEDGSINLEECIYIDWGTFINAVISFLVTAFVLFCIVRFINHLREKQDAIEAHARRKILTKSEIKELRANGIKIKDRKAVDAYFDEKERLAKEEAERAAAEAAAAERAANPTVEDLLKAILNEMRESK